MAGGKYIHLKGGVAYVGHLGMGIVGLGAYDKTAQVAKTDLELRIVQYAGRH